MAKIWNEVNTATRKRVGQKFRYVPLAVTL